ncbi:MAG: lipoprotein-releasing ABC transporter ATP-binding protein LolD [Neisseriaceae bacterium]|nr:lipoprotein-releasing ABC transporter ATP-binding protein LolD [Neisseriaceae bacterium PsAf]MCV2502725.1 lipoprotein-releasing ABC transporter ATP-binding protein LolD [Neisseriaceae bacterium]MCV2509429.1 lipoprotein-releasing ABC transporter ATP-binding protein LolD [Neisseriaceae bacterium]
MNNKVIIECQNISKTYQDGHLNVEVIKDLNLTVHSEESIAIIGASGSGKSTLLQLMGGLDYQTSGIIKIMGSDIQSLNQTELGLWRNQNLGFIYQFHHLLPEFTALENVMMPLLIANKPVKTARDKALQVLEQVNLENRIDHRPSELSGGEKQRVSIARAIANDPACILADEPTGNLDKRNAQNIIKLLLDLKNELNLSFVVVTHDEALITHFDRILVMSDRQLYPATEK